MELRFLKFQATGNDFILVDNRNLTFKPDQKTISYLCDRKFGIGSDGLILIEPGNNSDFNMVFFNPDGTKSFCGNGSRCAVSFYHEISGKKKSTYVFSAIDGNHKGHILNDSSEVSVTLSDLGSPQEIFELGGSFLNTGSPHFVKFEKTLDFDIISRSRPIRNNKEVFGNSGTNVNFVQILKEGSIFVRTYERGVEDETLSCGTGVTACSLIYSHIHNATSPITVKTRGGELSVAFRAIEEGFTGVELKGPAEMVFSGSIDI